MQKGGNGAVRVHGDGGGANTTTLAYDLSLRHLQQEPARLQLPARRSTMRLPRS